MFSSPTRRDAWLAEAEKHNRNKETVASFIGSVRRVFSRKIEQNPQPLEFDIDDSFSSGDTSVLQGHTSMLSLRIQLTIELFIMGLPLLVAKP